MSKKSIFILPAILAIVFSVLACSLTGETDKNTIEASASEEENLSTPEQEENKPEVSEQSDLKSSFPLPEKSKVVQSSNELVTATVSLPMMDVIDFYRQEAKNQKLTEYELLTAISDSTFSLVFQGSSNGKNLVVQGTEIDNNSVAFSVRYE